MSVRLPEGKLSSLQVALQGRHLAAALIQMLKIGAIFVLCSRLGAASQPVFQGIHAHGERDAGFRRRDPGPSQTGRRSRLLSDSAQVHAAGCQSPSSSYTPAINTLQPPDRVR